MLLDSHSVSAIGAYHSVSPYESFTSFLPYHSKYCAGFEEQRSETILVLVVLWLVRMVKDGVRMLTYSRKRFVSCCISRSLLDIPQMHQRVDILHQDTDSLVH